ncbi:MAG: potassium channel protein [Actinobacteria bacterium HGW-Actinobacteria-10]|jgi:voltage-gated potassium channel|nr:MAG: potassium channel protein [Actinobacteria bacterium HGW-Actinobacteria-10]
MAISLFLVLLVIVGGVVGYVFIEGVPAFDALYMTVITVATVGFTETFELSTAGRAFTMLLIVSGLGVVLFAVGTFIDFVVEGHFRRMVEGRRMASDIGHLNKHQIVAGMGRVGSVVARVLADEGARFVVVDHDVDRVKSARANGWLIVHGDASDEGVLASAGIERAYSLITALDSDAANLFVTVTARAMNSELFIVARSSHESTESKLLAAGADRIMTPNVLGGRRMANMVLHPAVSDYLDLVSHGDSVEYRMQDVPLSTASSLVGKSANRFGIRASGT